MKSDDELKKEFYKYNATRPPHPNIAIIRRKLDERQAYIEAVEANDDKENSYEEAVEKLDDPDGLFFEEINQLLQQIPWRDSHSTEEEEDAVADIQRKIRELDQKRRQKLDDIGYESHEDSRADLFLNGEDED